MDLKRLIKLIEQMRTDINKCYENSVLIDEEVLRKSRKLDELLNKYHKFSTER